MKRKKELIVILSSLLVIVLSVSVAYFTTKILGTGKEISVESADLKVIFTSGSGTINGTNIEPGWSSTENTFTVKNESNGTYKYNIIIKDLINTFVTTGFLQYKITSTNGGYNMTDFADVPKSKTFKDVVLAYNISIDKDATHTYTVEFKYLESEDVDQSTDMGKSLTGKIFITKGTERPTLGVKLLEDNPTISERTDFRTVFTTNTANTLYKATENSTEVYYFSGADNIEGKCEYNGRVIFNKEYYKNLSVDECTETMSVCQNENMRLIFGLTANECSSQDGSIINILGVNYITGVEKPINNWVKFAGFYWRIIRTNSDGSIRLLYSGKNVNTTEGYIGKSAFNTTSRSPKYVGYMYGDSDTTLEEARTNTNDSTIKTYIDTWYANNLTSYTDYLSNDAIYCNDRELASGSTYSTSSSFKFKPYERLITNKIPTYDCTNKKDAFSVNNSEAKLKYPIALMTADEIAYAGAVVGTNAPMWYYTNSTYNSITGSTAWRLLSPYDRSSVVSDVWNAWGSESPGSLNFSGNVTGAYAVRPVVSLKSCIKYSTGNGASETPYEIVENGGC